jgi:hypothetical protein
MKLSNNSLKKIIKEELSQLEREAKELGYDAWADNLDEEELQNLIDLVVSAYNSFENPKKSVAPSLTKNQFNQIVSEELGKFLAEMSKEEEKFFGDEIKALVDNPDELYYVKTIKPRNPYVDEEERQFLNRRWIEENVGKYLGGGSFRDAYQIKSHPDKLLKISNRYMQYEPLDGQEYATVAEETNMLEIELFNKYPDYFPKVYISDKEKQGIPRWLVVEKAAVIEWDNEFIRQLVRSFKSIPKSYNLINDLIAEYFPSTAGDFPPSYNGGRQIDAEQWAYVAWESVGYNDPNKLKDVLKDLPVWDEKYGDVLKRDVDRVLDEEVLLDEAVAKVWKVLTSDQYLVKFWDMVNDLHIEYNELRAGNVGTDLKTRTKFLIIDISIFED